MSHFQLSTAPLCRIAFFVNVYRLATWMKNTLDFPRRSDTVKSMESALQAQSAPETMLSIEQAASKPSGPCADTLPIDCIHINDIIQNAIRFYTPAWLAFNEAQRKQQWITRNGKRILKADWDKISNRHNSHNYRRTKHGRKRSAGRNDIRRFLLDALKNKQTLCPSCNRSFLTRIMQVDHITPISKGGSNNTYNLRMLCKSCNSRKRDKMPDGLLNFDQQEYTKKQQDRYTIIHRSSTRTYHLRKPQPTIAGV